MRYGSVCSGIEAASVAWGPLGWSPAWLSEVDAFPSAVLAHHYPYARNLGDMLALPSLVHQNEIEAPDILVGGTPCQAFSVAGKRDSLADARGALTLAYVELANEIDRQRARDGADPCIIVWENVPGVLNTKDNAFGCFLAGLAGEDVPLQPSGKRWTNAGLVLGPQRAVAWRVLDAQYFGLAQRRRRVFVVASARDGFDPAAVLFEFDGLRRDSAPSREARQETAADAGSGFEVAGTLDSRVSGGGFPGSDGAMGGHVVPTPYQDVAHCLNAGGMGRIDYETESFVVNTAIPILEPGARTGVSTTDPRAGIGIGADGDPMFTLQAGKQHGVAYAADTAPYLRAGNVWNNSDSGMEAQMVVCTSVTGDIAHTLNTANNGKGCSEDGTGRGVPTIAFSSKDYGADATEDMAPTLRAGGHADSHANAGVPPAVTVALQGREGGATAEVGGEVTTALRASTGGGDKPHVLTSMSDTLYSKGIRRGDGNARTQKTYPSSPLSALRAEAGEKAFTQWGLGVLDSLQPAPVLQSLLHGSGVRYAPLTRCWPVYCALAGERGRAAGAVQSVRDAERAGCTPPRPEYSEQLARELGAYLSELSQPGAQTARLVRDLWQASEGFGLLQQALSTFQEMGRSDANEAKPAHATVAVRRLTVSECEFLQGFPRNYTLVPYRKKPAADGPRYKALGNSMAVPVMRWIGQRIIRHLNGEI